MDAPTFRPTDRALWDAVIHTVETAIVPALEDPFARDQATRLVGLARYARDRGPDPSAGRRSQLRALIGDDDPLAVLTDADDPRRDELRRMLLDWVDADLAVEEPLLARFHGAPGVT